MGFLDFLTPVKSKNILFADEKTLAEKGSEKDRIALAKNERTTQEILYYLSDKDPSPQVRKAAAANPSTPMQAAPLLSKDRDEDVRLTIARKLVKILPSLTEEKYSQLYAFAVQSLGMLALDEVLKIRKALSETLKDYAATPPALAAQLARDLEREVSEPILRFCAALGDGDMIDILKTHPANWAAEAIAGRKMLSNRVSQAVIDSGNVVAGGILLNNQGAQISQELLEHIVERAKEHTEWHKPLVARKALPPLMARKLAAYVDKSVRKLLLERSDLDEATIKEISEVIQRRIAFEEDRRKNFDRSNPIERAQKLHTTDDLTEEVMSDAIAMQDREFVMAGLALRANASINDVEKVFDVRAAKSICAVCWRAGFSARLALKLQQTLGRIPPSQLMYPRGGTDYPIAPEIMRLQLDVIGIE